MKVDIFADAEYRERMDGEVASWWKEAVRPLRYKSYDGTKIQAFRALRPDAAKAIVMVHGFTEYTEKFAELMYYFYQAGYSVFMYDQRGHGRSGRKIANHELVFVRSFDEYVRDLRYFIDSLVKKEAPEAELFLYGHSMGGCICALFLEQYPELFKAAVLSSPMLKMDFGGRSDALVKAMAIFSRAANWFENPAPGAMPYSPEPDFANTCATSEVRYHYTHEKTVAHKAYRTCGATYAWVRAAMAATKELQKNAAKASLPILVCQAGNDDVVDNAGQDSFVENAPYATLVRFPEAKHEIYRSPKEILEVYCDTIFSFFDKQH